MTTPIVVPRLGVKVTEVTVLRWLVAGGASVTEGEPILVVETDKVEVEIEAPASGAVQTAAAEGEIHPVGSVIGAIV